MCEWQGWGGGDNGSEISLISREIIERVTLNNYVVHLISL